MKQLLFILFSIAVLISCTPKLAPSSADKAIIDKNLPLDLIRLPAGFKIDVYANNVKDARSMALSPKGILFVGTRPEGKVYAIVDTINDKKADKVYTIAQNLNMPNGIAFIDGALYVAEVHRILKYENIENLLEKPPAPKVIYDKLPTEKHHGWRYIAFGPDGLLYYAVGAPCNVCEKSEPYYATIMRMRKDGSNAEVYASGVRNSVGFDWDPQTKELWFTDNGRDLLGDDVPPDELNHAPKMGLHFGFPYCHGGTIADPEFGSKRKCSEFIAPAQNFGAHVASLGARFYTGSMFPAEYKNQIFVAEHGSWNRTKKSGYKISLVRLTNKKVTSYQTFAEGFKQGEEKWGRPVDLLVMPDGSMLVSDDYAGAIYRISYK